MLRRKTKSEREQSRLEGVELTRRIRYGEPLGLRNEKVTTPDPEAVRAIREYDTALRDLSRASQLPAPGRERAACEKHPAWQPFRPFVGAPLPPSSLCPYCLEEAQRKPEGPPREEVPGIIMREPTEAQEEIWERHREKLLAKGLLLSGSDAERAALRRIKELRSQERAQAGGEVVYQSVFDPTRFHVRRWRPRKRDVEIMGV